MLPFYALLFGAFGTLKGDYLYPVPQPPPLFDEPISTPAPVYVPPPLNDPLPPSNVYLPPSVQYPPIGAPPLNDEILPPFETDDSVIISAPPSNQYLPPTSRAPVALVNMSCLNTKDGHFRTLIRSNHQNRIFPSLDKSTTDCPIQPLTSDTFQIDFTAQKMIECGVKTCGTRLCLNLRMATVPGLRLIDDSFVTLQCIPQEPVVAHTKHLKLNTNSEQGRANLRTISVTSGGGQHQFETEMVLLRKNSNGFDQQVAAGSAVRLGDELLLRTSVKDGNGWRYSKMGAVVIRSGTTQKSVLLVDDNGCRSSAMKNICPHHPQQVNSLTIQLPFRAFLFQGASSAEDLLLSVRMIGCLRARDCYQTRLCDDGSKVRSARSPKGNFSEVVNETEFQFRVLPNDSTESSSPQSLSFTLLVFITFLFCFMITGLILLLFLIVKTCKKCLVL